MADETTLNILRAGRRPGLVLALICIALLLGVPPPSVHVNSWGVVRSIVEPIHLHDGATDDSTDVSANDPSGAVLIRPRTFRCLSPTGKQTTGAKALSQHYCRIQCPLRI